MTVGELSRMTGVPTKNLRAYTDWGLIYSVGRTSANYRLYDSEALWCVRAVIELRCLGLTLAEIRDLTAAYLERSGQPIGPRLAEILRRSRDRVQCQIGDLRATLTRIDDYMDGHRDELEGRAGGAVWAGDPRG
jgi:MerR family copper efflux transcriptional regulator